MINKIKEAYLKYIELNYSARSSEPANIVHDAIKDMVESILVPGDGLSVRTTSAGGEFKFASEIHEKKIDITVIETISNLPVLAISFKMPLASVNKNLKNYFEMNIGDTTLVKENGTPFYYFMVLDNNSIKFADSLMKSDLISNTSINSFSKVMASKYYAPYRPNHTFITKIDFGDSSHKAAYENTAKSGYVRDKAIHSSVVNAHTPTGEVYNSDGTWTSDFDNKIDLLKQSIKLDIELFKIRRQL